MLAYVYRYSSIANFILNKLKFKKLKCGKNVVLNFCSKAKFSFGKGNWLAEGTRIDIFNSEVQLSDNVNLCRHTYVSPNRSGIKIGKRSKLQEYGRLLGEITIGDDVIIAPNFYMSSGVHVFNQEPHLLVALQDTRHESLGAPCKIDDDCWIGMNVCVMPGVHIKRGCIIGAGAVVTRSTEPYGIYAGVPAKKIGSRLTLISKTFLDGKNPEDLPYFYQGFDHFNYFDNMREYQGILTNAATFFIYTEISQLQSVKFEIESRTNGKLLHQGISYEIKPGINRIIVNKVAVTENLIQFSGPEKLIIKNVTLN